MRHFLAFLILTVGFGTAAHAQGPSYDCNAARTPTEFAICASPDLSRLDVIMVDAYKDAQIDAPTAEKAAADQSIWRRWRNTCLGDQACLTRRYTARIADLAPTLILPDGFDFELIGTPSGDPSEAGVITRLNGNRYERVYPDGTIRWTEVNGIDSGVIFPDGSVSLFSPIQVGGAEMPQLPGNATAWATVVEAQLLSIVDTHLPPEDHAEYRDLQSPFPLSDRLLNHIEAIRFLSFR